MSIKIRTKTEQETNPSMDVSEQSKDDQFEGDEDYSESGGSDPDSDEDPSYSILEETHAKFSNLSIKKKKSKARFVSHP